MTDSVSIDVAVIGAGAVGLAVARAILLTRPKTELAVLEASDVEGSGISSRNSEVIHAGMYYPTGSLKSRLCVDGRRALYTYLEQRRVPYRKCEKLIVATSDKEMRAISEIYVRGVHNGVEGLQLIDASQARKLEPALSTNVVGALQSPETGIFDCHAYMRALMHDIQDFGGHLLFDSPVLHGEVCDGGTLLSVGGSNPCSVLAKVVVNCAGLDAAPVATRIVGWPRHQIPTVWFAKGSYFRVSGRCPFSRLIYPTPVDGGLGVHLTFDLAGAMRFGPDVEWLPEDNQGQFDYAVDERRASGFGDVVRRYWADVPVEGFVPDYAGIRPKLTAQGEPAGDFLVDHIDNGSSGKLIGLFGIESPGLTASLSLAKLVASLASN